VEFADRFRDLRVQAGLTKAALARPKYTGSYVTQIEAGRRRPSPEANAYFAGRLGVTPDFLATGVPEGAEGTLEFTLEESRMSLRRRHMDESERLARSVVSEAAGYDLRRIECRARSLLGDVLAQTGRVREAIDAYEDALQGELTSREAGMTLVSLGAAYREVGDLAYAVELLEGHLAAHQEGPIDPTVAVALQAVLISVYMERGDVHRAERAARRALMQVEVFAKLGKWDDALDLATRARVLMEEIDDRRSVARLHHAYAFLCLEVDPPRLSEARRHLDLAEAMLSAMGSPDDLTVVYQERARLSFMEGDAEESLRHIELAVERPSPNELARAGALLLKGRVLARMNRIADAKPVLFEAAAIFEKHGGRQGAALSWRELGELELSEGDTTAAIDAMRAGLEAMDPVQWPWETPRS
jgi:tetratricopeptide (TPR) repeat protein